MLIPEVALPVEAREVFYRKWRPSTLSEVVGQEPITTTLRNSVRQNRVSHAYLFCGTRGTGKTSTARILAKAVNCLSPQDGEPDNECRICNAFNEGRSMDLIEIDAASNRGVNDIRDLNDKVRFSPSESRYKIYIIDEAHQLTSEANNALLKTLEEPPPHVIFILATTEAHKVPVTVVSRCMRFDFRRIAIDQITEKLSEISKHEGVEVSEGALRIISRAANGGLRDAENMLEQAVVSYGSPVEEDNIRQLLGLGGNEAALEFVRYLLSRNVQSSIETINEVSVQGTDLIQFLRGAQEYLRSVLLKKTGVDVDASMGYSDDVDARLKALASCVDMEHLMRCLKIFAGINLRRDATSTLPLEIGVIEAIGVQTVEQDLITQGVGNTPQHPVDAKEELKKAEAEAGHVQAPTSSAAPPEHGSEEVEARTPEPKKPDERQEARQSLSVSQPSSPAVKQVEDNPEDQVSLFANDEVSSFVDPPEPAQIAPPEPLAIERVAQRDGELMSIQELEEQRDVGTDDVSAALEVERHWNQIADELRFVGHKMKIGAMLRSAKVREVRGKILILKYPSHSNMERMQQELDLPDSRRIVEETIAKSLGIPYRVDVEYLEVFDGGKRASQISPLVRAAESMGARVVRQYPASAQ